MDDRDRAPFRTIIGCRAVPGPVATLPSADFPWFRGADLQHILHVTMPRAHYLRWPELDIDLTLESIRHPERCPRIAATRAPARPPRP